MFEKRRALYAIDVQVSEVLLSPDLTPEAWIAALDAQSRAVRDAAAEGPSFYGFTAPDAFALIESWPDPESAMRLLADLRFIRFLQWDLFTCNLLVGESGQLVIYQVPEKTWTRYDLSTSPHRVTLALEPPHLWMRDSVSRQGHLHTLDCTTPKINKK